MLFHRIKGQTPQVGAFRKKLIDDHSMDNQYRRPESRDALAGRNNFIN